MLHTHPEGFLEAREAYYQRLFGPLDQPVMHSTDIKPAHIDVYQFKPTDRRPFWTLITSGMSNFRQLAPEDCEDGMAPRAEVLMYVSSPKPWMFNVLKGLAEMPFIDRTYLHWWHTVQNGMPMTATPSLLTAFFFLPPYFEGTDLPALELDGDQVDLLWLIPITEGERRYAMENGSQQLEELLANAELAHVVDEGRRSIV